MNEGGACVLQTQNPKDIKRQSLPQPHSVHPAAIWQEIQKYPLPYHQTTEQIFILCTCELKIVLYHLFIN